MRKKIFSVLALLLLLAPAALAPWRVDMPARRPDAAQTDFLSAPLSFVEERLALKTLLITLRAKALSLLGESGSDQVIAGREDFLFYGDTLADYQQSAPLPQAELDALADGLARLHQAFQAENRGFILLIAPNKNSIYPEYMPARLLPGPGESDLSRLQNALDARGVPYLDAREILLAAKEKGLVYFKQDTHWNARGALAVYQALTEYLPGVKTSAAQEPVFLPGQAGDLLLLCQPGGDPTEPDAQPELERSYRALRPIRSLNDLRIETASSASALSLLVLRDSFGEGLFPYLATLTGRMTYSRVYDAPLAQARKAQAEMVILEIAERNLKNLSHALEEVSTDGRMIPP